MVVREIPDIECGVPDLASKPVYVKLWRSIRRVKWANVILLGALHAGFVYALYHAMTRPVKTLTLVASPFLGAFSGLGMTVGGHRLWAHRSFKAKLPVRLLLLALQTMTMNGSAYSYARDHRTHHKFTDTDADPKNPARGLFYSHIGWWMLKKSPKVIEHGRKLDYSDLRDDPLVWFQHRHYTLCFLLLGVLLPTLGPVLLWGEDPLTAFLVCVVLRITVVLHHLFTVNSITHYFGSRPYDFRIRPTENRLVIYMSMGEGNHNYHHTFPYDYASCDKLWWEGYNPATLFIDFFAFLGLCYECKKASPAVIEGTVSRKGIPAHFDPRRSLHWRILNGILDWIIGLCVLNWIAFIVLPYKYFTGQNMFVF